MERRTLWGQSGGSLFSTSDNFSDSRFETPQVKLKRAKIVPPYLAHGLLRCHAVKKHVNVRGLEPAAKAGTQYDKVLQTTNRLSDFEC